MTVFWIVATPFLTIAAGFTVWFFGWVLWQFWVLRPQRARWETWPWPGLFSEVPEPAHMEPPPEGWQPRGQWGRRG